jgi:hypothetical protein
MGGVYDLVNMAKTEFPKSKLILSGFVLAHYTTDLTV